MYPINSHLSVASNGYVFVVSCLQTTTSLSIICSIYSSNTIE